MSEPDLHDALMVSLSSPIEEVVTHAEVINEQLKTIQDLGGLGKGDRDLYDEVKAVSYVVLCREVVLSLEIENYYLVL